MDLATVNVVSSPAAARRAMGQRPGPIVLVPTMGALHAGHLALLAHARKLAGDNGTVVASIFVNPTQFGPKEDFSRYPRPFARDKALCREQGVDLLFHPSVRQMYAADHSTDIEEKALSAGLCGATRPGHFRGVCTIVLKLFNIIQPAAAVFGEKDYQQLAVIRRMVRDLNLSVRIVGVPTVREPDGLALSSRNKYLSVEERAEAPLLRKGLGAAAAACRGGVSSVAKLRGFVRRTLAGSVHARIDYIEIVDADSLAPLRRAKGRVLIAAAVFFGRTRLIDNIRIR